MFFTYDTQDGLPATCSGTRRPPQRPSRHYDYDYDAQHGSITLQAHNCTDTYDDGRHLTATHARTYSYGAYGAQANVQIVMDTNDPQTTANSAASASPAPTETHHIPLRARHMPRRNDLYDYGLRYYHSGLGRWLNRDPIGEAGGVNVHAFLVNAPLSRVDPFGLTPELSLPPDLFRPSPPSVPSVPPDDGMIWVPGEGLIRIPQNPAPGGDHGFGPILGWLRDNVGTGTYLEWGLLLGGRNDAEVFVGYQWLDCCDARGYGHAAYYKKECRGVAVGVSLGVTAPIHLDGENCPRGWEGNFLEVTLGSVDISLPADERGVPRDPFSGDFPSGIGYGIGLVFKVAICSYEMLLDLETGCCEREER